VPTWDADLYLKFGRERTQPAIDLVSRISVENPRNIIDLGCGPGNSTAILRQRWPDAKITGLDSSEAMITQAAGSDSETDWQLGDIAAWDPEEDFDVIFSNAAIQWLGDHGTLLTSLAGHLAPGGALAIQLPDHYASPLHQVLLVVSRNPDWSDSMDSARGALTYESVLFYYDTLRPLCRELEIWETEYFHTMEGPEAIVDYIRGTGLRPFLEALQSDEDRGRFEELVLRGYSNAYPLQKDGSILFPFRRQFIVGYK